MKFYNFKRVWCAAHGGYANKASGRPLRSGKLSPRSAPVSALGGEAAGWLAGVHTPHRAETRVSDVLCMCDQCMKVKSESEVAQSCLTLSDPMDCSLPGSSIHGIFQARVLEWGAIAFPRILGYTSIIFENDIECLTELLGIFEKLSLKSSSRDKPPTELI